MAARGPAAAQALALKLDREWLQLKSIRQRFTCMPAQVLFGLRCSDWKPSLRMPVASLHARCATAPGFMRLQVLTSIAPCRVGPLDCHRARRPGASSSGASQLWCRL